MTTYDRYEVQVTFGGAENWTSAHAPMRNYDDAAELFADIAEGKKGPKPHGIRLVRWVPDEVVRETLGPR